MTSRKAEYLRRIRHVEQICEQAGDFPTIPQIDEMLLEMRYLPRSQSARELIGLLLEIRWQLAA